MSIEGEVTLDHDLRKTYDEQRFVEDLKKIKGGSPSEADRWAEFNQLLSTGIRLQLHLTESTRKVVADVIEFLLSEPQLQQAWGVVAKAFYTKSQSASHNVALQMTSAYKTISNFVGSHADFTTDPRTYAESLARSLLNCIREAHLNENEQDITALTANIRLLSSDFQSSVVSVIFGNSTEYLFIVDYLPSQFVLTSTYLYLRRRYSARNGTNSRLAKNPTLSMTEAAVLSRFIGRALEDCYPMTVVNALVMQKAFVPSIAEFLVNLLPESCHVELLDSVGSLWGEKLFISRGDWHTQEYLTAVLISTLRRVSGDQLSQRKEDGLPIASILSAGVSAYLDQSDKKCRLRGMKIAKEFSILLGHEIAFEELEEEKEVEKEVEKEKRLKNDAQVLTIVKKAPVDINLAPRRMFDGDNISDIATMCYNDLVDSDSDSDSSGDYDSDSDGEIEGYDIPTTTLKSSVPLTSYLRICLELLQCSDNDKDAHDKQLSALLSIPKVVRTCPVDAGDVCGPLVRELLRLTNSYNTTDFELLRTDAVHSLVVAYPSLAASVLCRVAEEKDTYSLSVRMFAVSSLGRAALELSSVPSTSSSGGQKDALTTPANDDASLGRNASTVIKRKAMLASGNKKTTYFVNNFAPVGALFFYPILHLLALESGATDGSSALLRGVSLTSPIKIKEKKKVAVLDSDESGDGLHSMLPTEALLALAAFNRSCINTVHQSIFAIETMKAAFSFRESSSLSMRRASLTALYSSFDSWMHLKKRRRSLPSHSVGVMESLSDVSGTHSRQGGATSVSEREEYALVAMIVDWAVPLSKSDADENCRILMVEMIRIAIEVFSLLENDDSP